jgi:hypothetical protein
VRQASRIFLGGVTLALAGCAASSKVAPPRLLDGSRPAPPPAALGRLQGPLALGRVRAVPARAADQPRLTSCLRRFPPLDRLPPGSVVVERLGVSGASLTFRDPHEPVLDACDSTAAGPRFCGGAAGLLRRGHLLDPRLELICNGHPGRPGFAWVEPAPGARWIAVEERAYTELYQVAGHLPVRVTTSEVEPLTSSAVFRVRQYAADGSQVARTTLEARVAG